MDTLTEAKADGTLAIPLLPRHGIYLRILGEERQLLEMLHVKGRKRSRLPPGVRFAECFRSVWGRMPLTVRRTLLRYWRKCWGAFRIEITRDRMEGFNAACADGGFTLTFRFWLDWPFPNMPRREVMRIIAHELAHVHRFATGNARFTESTVVSETETIKLASSWGFPQKPFNPAGYREAIKLDRELERLHRSGDTNT